MNNINRKQLIIGGVVVLALLAIIVGILWSRGSLQSLTSQKVSTNDPVDVVSDFYQPWLKASQSTSTDPYKLGLAKDTILSPELRKRLVAFGGHAKTEIDPVLCQTTVPEKITTRVVSLSEEQAQVLVVSKDPKQTAQSVFSLAKLNDGWFIKDITCSLGEFGPEREFTFDQEGYLLKSVVAPLNPKYWHLVFVENGQAGHAAPLFFSTDSTCAKIDGVKAVCDTTQFAEATKAHVQGEMTETGVKVKVLQMLK